MKIISLHFKNVNSLAGEWTIRFDDPAFSWNRLFAISGPTGSGKTSVLDAISLALYGKTSRQDNIADPKGLGRDINDLVMTKGTDRTFSEVEFEASGSRYKAFWEAHRTKSGGISSELKLLFNENGTFVPRDEVSKKKEIKAKIAEIVGLDFSQFMRAVMLPQGSFDTFLKSSREDKAKILEKLSGQGIYRDISKAAFERAKSEKIALEQLHSQMAQIQVLSDSEARDLEASLKNQAEVQKSKTEDKKRLEKSEQILVERTTQEEICRNLDANVSKLKKENADLAPAKERLARSQKAQTLSGDLKEISIIRDGIAKNQAQLTSIEKSIPEKKNALADLKSKAEKLFGESENLKREDKDREELRKEIDQIDGDIASDKKLAADKEQLIHSQKKNLETLRQKKLEGETKKKQFEESKASCLRYRETYAAHENLEKILGTISDRFELWGDAKRSEEKANVDLNAAKKRLANVEDQLDKASKNRDARAQEFERSFSDDLGKVALFLQAQLKEGDACPVCGGTFHASADCTLSLGTAASTANRVMRLKEELEKAKEHCKNLEYECKTAREARDHLLEDLNTAVTKSQECFAAVMNLLQPYEILESELQSPQAVLDKIQKWISWWKQSEEKLKKCETELLQLESERKNIDDQTREAEAALKNFESEWNVYRTRIQENSAKRESKFGVADVGKDRDEWRQKIEGKNQESQKAREGSQTAEHELSTLRTQQEELSDHLKSEAQKEAAKKSLLSEKLLSLGFASEEAANAAILPESEFQNLETKIQQNETALLTEKGRLQQANERLVELRAKDVGQETLQTVRSKLETLTSELQNLAKSINENLQKKIENDQAKKHREKLEAESLEREKTFAVWNKLKELIGSADGKLFVEYVQSLTLQKLIGAANSHLKNLSPRYRLESGAGLNISLFDSECGTSRLSANLSGGESFLVSLALALGLSSLASQKVRIDTLFLDEGFGTLDEHRLQKALDVLRNIGTCGDKLVGVISHVERLKDEISNHIEIIPVGNGHSRIVGPGVSAG